MGNSAFEVNNGVGVPAGGSTGQVLAKNSGTDYDTEWVAASGATNLAATLSSSNTIITSDTGTDATIPAVDATNAGVMTPTQKTKLDGIATGATANDTDANLKNRANHTGTQTLSTISDVTASAAELNTLDGITASTAELNVLDGITASTAELNYTGGVTSAIQTQLNGKEASISAGTTSQYWRGDKSWQTLDKTAVGLGNVDNTSDATKNSASATLTNKTINTANNTITGLPFVLTASANTSTPADATTLYFGGVPVLAMQTTTAVQRIYPPRAGTITAVRVTFYQTAGSNETSTVSLRLNNTTDTTISSAVTNDAAVTTFLGTGLSIAVTTSDYVEIKWVTPTWATNPTNLRAQALIYFETT